MVIHFQLFALTVSALEALPKALTFVATYAVILITFDVQINLSYVQLGLRSRSCPQVIFVTAVSH